MTLLLGFGRLMSPNPSHGELANPNRYEPEATRCGGRTGSPSTGPPRRPKLAGSTPPAPLGGDTLAKLTSEQVVTIQVLHQRGQPATQTARLLGVSARPLPTEARRTPPDLAEVVAAWPELPEAVRAGIVAMIRAASGGGKGR
jgi:hypothetical protein